ncbi:hypothetical protein NQZ68_023881 [Dissostichus eleginoides]|nr:hypothetical protein NQZ68_023881 [Dissostichus eleginoides]
MESSVVSSKGLNASSEKALAPNVARLMAGREWTCQWSPWGVGGGVSREKQDIIFKVGDMYQNPPGTQDHKCPVGNSGMRRVLGLPHRLSWQPPTKAQTEALSQLSRPEQSLGPVAQLGLQPNLPPLAGFYWKQS